MRAWVPAAICLGVILYCCHGVYLAKRSYFPPGASYKVDVTVTGPDGQAIPAVEQVSP
jgi:hypothetical protein